MSTAIRILAVAVLGGLGALALVLGGPTVEAGDETELDEAEVFIEWNSTDTDFGIQFFWDGEPWHTMVVRNEDGKRVLSVRASRGVRAQGLTEITDGLATTDCKEGVW